MYNIVEFDEDNKWFVISEKEIDEVKYSYMIRVNNSEDDFLNQYIVVKSNYDGNNEYMELVNDSELLKKVMPVLVPESSQFIGDVNKMKEMLRKIEK